MKTGICIDLRNKKQLKWWNTIGNKLCKVTSYADIVETATNKKVAILLGIRGPFAKAIEAHNVRKFIKDPVRKVFDENA